MISVAVTIAALALVILLERLPTRRLVVRLPLLIPQDEPGLVERDAHS